MFVPNSRPCSKFLALSQSRDHGLHKSNYLSRLRPLQPLPCRLCSEKVDDDLFDIDEDPQDDSTEATELDPDDLDLEDEDEDLGDEEWDLGEDPDLSVPPSAFASSVPPALGLPPCPLTTPNGLTGLPASSCWLGRTADSDPFLLGA